MKKEKLLNAIGQIDDNFITEAKPEVKTQKKKSQTSVVCAVGDVSYFGDLHKYRDAVVAWQQRSGQSHDGNQPRRRVHYRKKR